MLRVSIFKNNDKVLDKMQTAMENKLGFTGLLGFFNLRWLMLERIKDLRIEIQCELGFHFINIFLGFLNPKKLKHMAQNLSLKKNLE